MTRSLLTLLKKYNLHPHKGLGQNFLADPHHLNKIIATAELSPNDLVLEIGPGPGTLTRLLAEAAGQVVAVELDPNMVNLLNTELGHLPNLTIIEADILNVSIANLFSEVSSQKSVVSSQNFEPKTQSSELETLNSELETLNSELETLNSELKTLNSELKTLNSELRTQNSELKTQNSELKTQNSELKTQNYKVVANLPYYITSAVLRRLLEAALKPQRLVVTVQKEVAQRIVAGPGNMSLLAVSVQFYGQPTLAHHIPAGAFYPPPKVDSAVVRIDVHPQPAANVTDVGFFFEVVKAGFGQKRKQLKNALAAGLHKPVAEVSKSMGQAGIDPTRRAETLNLEEWGRLVEALRSVL
jgi:16S rRNA (adenine1518-N6/adenine1519-N6)-dimethyltransferase